MPSTSQQTAYDEGFDAGYVCFLENKSVSLTSLLGDLKNSSQTPLMILRQNLKMVSISRPHFSSIQHSRYDGSFVDRQLRILC